MTDVGDNRDDGAGIVMYCTNCGWTVEGAANSQCPECRRQLNFVSWKDGERKHAMQIVANNAIMSRVNRKSAP